MEGRARIEERRVENEMEVKENSLLPHFNLANLLFVFKKKKGAETFLWLVFYYVRPTSVFLYIM